MKKKKIIELRAKVRQPVAKLPNKQFIKNLFLKISNFVHRPTTVAVADKNGR